MHHWWSVLTAEHAHIQQGTHHYWLLQDKFNEAYAPPEFALAQRVADLMLVCCVALMFGSGMPFCYLIAFVVLLATAATDRCAALRVCAVTSRYAHQLPGLVIGA